MKNILIICGPTASGKTSLALALAKKLVGAHHDAPVSSPSVHILSADSRQVYQGLDIVTGKDIPQDLPPGIKFFGLNIVNPSESFNLSDYVTYARQVMEDSLASKTPLIIVGGTGLYLQAITSSLLTVQVPPDQKLRTRLEKLDLATLKKQLAKMNPEKFSSLNNSDANNPRRLIRAIEITQSPSPKESPRQVLLRGDSLLESSHHFHWVGLKQDKEVQKKKIRQRVIDRLEHGAIQEVESLKQSFPHQEFSLFTSLGVKEIMCYLDQKITYDELLDLWSSAEIDYARRQMVWFKKQPGIIWYDIDSESPSAQKLAKVITTK